MAIADYDYFIDFNGQGDESPFVETGFTDIQNTYQIDTNGLRPTGFVNASLQYDFEYTAATYLSGITIITNYSSSGDRLGAALWVASGANAGKGYIFDINGTSGTIRRRDAATGVGSGLDASFGFTGQANGDEYALGYDPADGTLTAYHNGSSIATRTDTTYQSEDFVGGIAGSAENSNNRRIGKFGVDGIAAAGPAINPTGTDTDLINGTSADVVFSGLTSDPASIEVVWDNGVDSAISSTQADFSLGTVTDGVATATVTATIGNLPYTDATYLTADYSYLVTCDDDSEITFDTLTFAPETGSSFITVASPVNDSTSILPSETLANGQQLEWPDEVVISESNTATLDVLADGQFTIEWSGAAASFTFTLRFWDGAEWFDIATTINTAGEVVSGGGLTRVGLTRAGLTTAGLTAVGL